MARSPFLGPQFAGGQPARLPFQSAQPLPPWNPLGGPAGPSGLPQGAGVATGDLPYRQGPRPFAGGQPARLPFHPTALSGQPISSLPAPPNVAANPPPPTGTPTGTPTAPTPTASTSTPRVTPRNAWKWGKGAAGRGLVTLPLSVAVESAFKDRDTDSPLGRGLRDAGEMAVAGTAIGGPKVGIAGGLAGASTIPSNMGRELREDESKPWWQRGLGAVADVAGYLGPAAGVKLQQDLSTALGGEGRGTGPLGDLAFGWFGDQADEARAMMDNEAVAERVPQVDNDPRSILAQFDLSTETTQQALEQLESDMLVQRVLAERGMVFDPTDDSDDPAILSPEAAEELVFNQWLNALPEIVEMDRVRRQEEEEAFARAAAWAEVSNEFMQPHLDQIGGAAQMHQDWAAGVGGADGAIAQANAGRAVADAEMMQGALGAVGQMMPFQQQLQGTMEQDAQFQAMLQNRMMNEAINQAMGGQDDPLAGEIGDEEWLAELLAGG